MTSLQAIARALGGDVITDKTGPHVRAPGPGHSKKDDSLSIHVDPTAPSGVRVHSFAGDDWRDCLDYVKGRCGIGDVEPARDFTRLAKRPTPDDGARIKWALELWTASRPARGTLVETYLVGRGLTLPEGAEALRFHPACPFRLEDGSTARLPAMVALMRDIITDEPCGAHRTALKPDGSGKADLPGLGTPKKMLGRAKGACIKLSADDDVTTGLGIAEGIETALTALTNGWAPIWACSSAGNIAAFPILAGVECLTIFADADPAGLAAAQECQARWQAAGRECPIVLPPHDGCDWNDWRRP